MARPSSHTALKDTALEREDLSLLEPAVRFGADRRVCRQGIIRTPTRTLSAQDERLRLLPWIERDRKQGPIEQAMGQRLRTCLRPSMELLSGMRNGPWSCSAHASFSFVAATAPAAGSCLAGILPDHCNGSFALRIRQNILRLQCEMDGFIRRHRSPLREQSSERLFPEAGAHHLEAPIEILPVG